MGNKIFASIKNEGFKKGLRPDAFALQAQMVYQFGVALPYSGAIIKRREKLGLPEIKISEDALKEVQKLMIAADLDMSETEEEASTQ